LKKSLFELHKVVQQLCRVNLAQLLFFDVKFPQNVEHQNLLHVVDFALISSGNKRGGHFLDTVYPVRQKKMTFYSCR